MANLIDLIKFDEKQKLDLNLAESKTSKKII